MDQTDTDPKRYSLQYGLGNYIEAVDKAIKYDKIIKIIAELNGR